MATIKTDITGQAFYCSWKPAGASEIDLSNYVKKFDDGLSHKAEDNTTMGDSLMTSQPVLPEVAPKMTMAFRDSVAAAAIRKAMKSGTQGQLVWGWEGNAAGKPKWGIEAYITDKGTSAEVGKIVTQELSFVNAGDTWLYDGDASATFGS